MSMSRTKAQANVLRAMRVSLEKVLSAPIKPEIEKFDLFANYLTVSHEYFNWNGVQGDLFNMWLEFFLVSRPFSINFPATSRQKYIEFASKNLQDVCEANKVPLLLEVGSIYWFLGENVKAIEIYESLLARPGTLLSEDLATVYTGLGLAYKDLGHYKLAIGSLTRAIELISERKSKAVALTILGRCHHYLRQPNLALLSFREAIKHAYAAKDRRGQADTLNNLAMTYFKIGARVKAMRLLEKAYNLSVEVNDYRGQANNANNRTLIHLAHRDYKNALTWAEEALRLSVGVYYIKGQYTSHLLIARIAFHQFKLAKAVHHFILALTTVKHTDGQWRLLGLAFSR